MVSNQKRAIRCEEPCPFDNLEVTKKNAGFVPTDLIYYRCLIRSRRLAYMAEQAGLAITVPQGTGLGSR